MRTAQPAWATPLFNVSGVTTLGFTGDMISDLVSTIVRQSLLKPQSADAIGIVCPPQSRWVDDKDQNGKLITDASGNPVYHDTGGWGAHWYEANPPDGSRGFPYFFITRAESLR